MENFYDDDFERYLREQTDQFKMEPSKKAWHGIYNNFHPGKRWPSIATGLMVITLLSLTNTLNTRQAQIKTFGSISNNDLNSEDNLTKGGHKKSDQISRNDASFDNEMIADLSAIEESNTTQKATGQPGLNNNNPSNVGIIATNITAGSPNSSALNSENIQSTNDRYNVRAANRSNQVSAKIIALHATNQIEGSNESNSENNSEALDIPANIVTSKLPITKSELTKTLPADRSNTLQLSKLLKKHQFSSKWSFYVSPTVNYRTIGRRTEIYNSPQFSSTAVSGAIQVMNVKEKTSQHPTIGFEAGAKVDFAINQKIRFFTGLQLNYSGYNISANATHPTLTSLEILDHGVIQDQSALSFYVNDNSSSSILHSYSLEAMVPLGLEYKVIDLNGISLNLMTAFLPSLVLNERSYLLSADTHYYISNSDMQRALNLNGEVGAFVGFKAGGLRYEIGPEFRYQILSNFKKSLPYSEHLINYGLRFSISH